MKKKLTYKDFLIRNWKDLLLLFIIMLPFITTIIFSNTILKIMKRVCDRSQDFNTKKRSGRYIKLENSDFEEIILVQDKAFSFMSQTILLYLLPMMFVIGLVFVLIMK